MGWSPSHSSIGKALTDSGNEITDAVRVAGVNGDGLTPPAGVGIWEATTNLFANGSFESGTAGWSSSDGVATIAQDGTVAKFGANSLKIVSTAANNGVRTNGAALTNGQAYSFGVWAKGVAGHQYIIQIVRADFATVVASQTFVASGGWDNVTCSVASYPATETAYCFVKQNDGHADTWWIDGAQLENKPIPTPFAGDGATRSAARVQAPASLLNATQCGVAYRIAYGFPSTATRANACYLLDWRDDANNLLGLWLDTANKWNAGRESGGAGSPAVSAAQTFTTDDTATVIFACDSGHAKVSVNGGAFTSVANTSIPTLAASLADLGSQAATDQLDGRILWAVTFVGVVTDADATLLDGSASVPTTLPGSMQMTASMPMVTSAYTLLRYSANSWGWESGWY